MLRKLLFHNFRVIYGLSHWLRHRFTPAGLLLLGIMVTSGIFGVNTRQTLAYQIFTFAAALLLVAALSAIRFRVPLRVARRLPQYGTMGQPLQYRVIVENPGSRGQPDLCLIDELHTEFPTYEEFRTTRDPEDRHRNWFDRRIGYPRLMGIIHRRRGAAIAPAALPAIAPRDRTELDMSFIPLRRGYLRFFRSRLARPDPLGLFRAVQNHVRPENLLVLPRLYRVPALKLGGRRKYQHGGITLASAVGDSQEFISLREYKPGDPLRAIHWRSFAKLGKPVVKEFQDEFFVRQGLVLDTFLGNRPVQLFEEAVSVAASFAAAVPDQDSLLDLMFVGTRTYRLTSGRGLGQTENMLEVLACVEPRFEDGVAKLNDLIMQNVGETSGLICVLLDWDRDRRDLVQRILALAIPVFVFVVTEDPGAIGAAAGPLADAPDRLVALPADAIQEALDRIISGTGTRS